MVGDTKGECAIVRGTSPERAFGIFRAASRPFAGSADIEWAGRGDGPLHLIH